ncbi:MAG: hypothetical protein KKG00_06700 [Bacteroidetes bacterium]|nr:hypothetical protein [Bacteroidota bacterium]
MDIEQLPAKLLVEGNDDLHVVLAICHQFKVVQSFGIVDSKGIDALLVQIPVRIKLRDSNLGILIDADVDIHARWQQLQNILTPLGYDLPEVPNAKGTIVNSSKATTIVGIWIMPNNQVPGMLEDFAKVLIPLDDAALPLATKAIDEVLNKSAAKFSPVHRSKALIHTWLAWQESPCTPLGLAITKSYLDHNHALCGLFVNWLNRLFNPESEAS